MPQGRIARAMALAVAALAVAPVTVALLDLLGGSEARAMALQTFGSAMLLGLLACAGAQLAARPTWERLGLRPGTLPWPTLLALTAGFVATSHGLDGTLRLLGLRETGALAELDRRLTGLPGRELGIVLVGLGLAPAVGEELFFRGLLQRGLEKRLGPLVAVALSAAAFGALHADPVHAPAAFVLGLYLGGIVLWSGGLRAAIAAHALNNVVAVLETAWDATPLESPAAAVALGVAVGVPPLWWAHRQARRPIPVPAAEQPDSRGDLQRPGGSADL